MYPVNIGIAKKALRNSNIEIASVGAAFPSGQTALSVKLFEIKYILDKEATEIDIPINRSYVLSDKWSQLFEEIREIKQSCLQHNRHVKLKTILSVGDLITYNNVSVKLVMKSALYKNHGLIKGV